MQNGYRLRLGSACRELCLNLEQGSQRRDSRLCSHHAEGDTNLGQTSQKTHTPVYFIAILLMGRLLVCSV